MFFEHNNSEFSFLVAILTNKLLYCDVLERKDRPSAPQPRPTDAPAYYYELAAGVNCRRHTAASKSGTPYRCVPLPACAGIPLEHPRGSTNNRTARGPVIHPMMLSLDSTSSGCAKQTM